MIIIIISIYIKTKETLECHLLIIPNQHTTLFIFLNHNNNDNSETIILNKIKFTLGTYYNNYSIMAFLIIYY